MGLGWAPRHDRTLGARRNAGRAGLVARWHGSHVHLLTCVLQGWLVGAGARPGRFQVPRTTPLSRPRLTCEGARNRASNHPPAAPPSLTGATRRPVEGP
eukprot:4167948-Prymnesium_polylepis.1